MTRDGCVSPNVQFNILRKSQQKGFSLSPSVVEQDSAEKDGHHDVSFIHEKYVKDYVKKREIQ